MYEGVDGGDFVLINTDAGVSDGSEEPFFGMRSGEVIITCPLYKKGQVPFVPFGCELP